MKKKKTKIIVAVASILIILGIGLGVKKHMDDKAFKKEMIKIVKSDEAQDAIKESIRINIDKNAFTDKSKIHSFTVDYKTIEHNPMGGIDIEGYINDNKKLEFGTILDKEDGKKISAPGMEYSKELQTFLGE